MANRARGETSIRIGSKSYAIALNLGALAALEDSFGVESYEEAFDVVLRAEKISARKIMDFLQAVIEGNGLDFDEEDIAKLTAKEMAAIALELMTRAFPEPDKKTRGKAKAEARP